MENLSEKGKLLLNFICSEYESRKKEGIRDDEARFFEESFLKNREEISSNISPDIFDSCIKELVKSGCIRIANIIGDIEFLHA